jgi:hypothetical protein
MTTSVACRTAIELGVRVPSDATHGRSSRLPAPTPTPVFDFGCRELAKRAHGSSGSRGPECPSSRRSTRGGRAACAASPPQCGRGRPRRPAPRRGCSRRGSTRAGWRADEEAGVGHAPALGDDRDRDDVGLADIGEGARVAEDGLAGDVGDQHVSAGVVQLSHDLHPAMPARGVPGDCRPARICSTRASPASPRMLFSG